MNLLAIKLDILLEIIMIIATREESTIQNYRIAHNFIRISLLNINLTTVDTYLELVHRP
jgi:hypothetical protein